MAQSRHARCADECLPWGQSGHDANGPLCRLRPKADIAMPLVGPYLPPSIICSITEHYAGAYRSHQPIGLILPSATWQAPAPGP